MIVTLMKYSLSDGRFLITKAQIGISLYFLQWCVYLVKQ